MDLIITKEITALPKYSYKEDTRGDAYLDNALKNWREKYYQICRLQENSMCVCVSVSGVSETSLLYDWLPYHCVFFNGGILTPYRYP